MENARNLAMVTTLWQSTNNTVGFIHMFSSSADKSALVIETMADYNAFFRDNDPRERVATIYNNHTGQTTQIGFPLVDAVYRFFYYFFIFFDFYFYFYFYLFFYFYFISL